MNHKFFAAVTAITGMAAGIGATAVMSNKKIEQKNRKVDKFKGYYYMLNQWLMLKQEGKSLEQYFINNGYKTIAIYGMGEIGSRLYDELKESGVEVRYAVDQDAASTYSDLKVIDFDDEFEDVDAVVVTATFAYDEIEKKLKEKIDFPIISLDDVVYEI